MRIDGETRDQREYALSVRRALKMILRALNGEQDAQRVDVAVVGAFLQFVADTERYTHASRGSSSVIKPMLVASVLESGSFRETLERAVNHLERRFFLGEYANARTAGPERGTPPIEESNRSA